MLIAWLQAINKHSWYNGKCYATKSCPRSKSHWLPAQTKYGIEQERFSIYLDFIVARKKAILLMEECFYSNLKSFIHFDMKSHEGILDIFNKTRKSVILM